MKLKKEQDSTTLKTENYFLTYKDDNPFYLDLLFENNIGAVLFIPSGCDRDEMIDEIISLEKPSIEQDEDRIVFSFSGKTTLWEKVVYKFECFEDKVLYGYTVEGSGSIDNARFFEGFLKNDPRMEQYYYPYFQGAHRQMCYHRPIKHFARSSVPNFDLLYSFSVNSSDTRTFMFHENTTVRVNGDRLYLGGDWLTTPPPYLYLLGKKEMQNWVSMGLAVTPGENTFCEYQYSGGEGFGFNLTYDGNTEVAGCWQSPKMIIAPSSSADVYEALKEYTLYLRQNEYVKTQNREKQPQWWSKPIFGGWGEQMYLSDYFRLYKEKNISDGCGAAGANHCTRSAYDKMLAELEDKGVDPTILIIDNRWFHPDRRLEVDEQAWPNMREFIDNQHAKGRKVILWVSMWDDLPHKNAIDLNPDWYGQYKDNSSYNLEINTDVFYKACNLEKKKIRKLLNNEAVEGSEGKINYFVNPQNKDYEESLRKRIDYLLSPDGLDADGFEFDYTHSVFSCSPHRLKDSNEGKPIVWGMEFLHSLLKIYYDQAKKTKPESLIIAHTFNPYFDDVVDMLRLQDIYTDFLEINNQMEHRAKIAGIVAPGCRVHTDQHPMPSLHAWRKYMPFQPQIGNPCLYYVSGIETTYEPFEEQDWQMLREVWGRYEKQGGDQSR